MADEQQIEAVREGSRWRYGRPSSDEVGAWFATAPLDEGMTHADFIAGIVLIPATEKVKRQVPGRAPGTFSTQDSFELTYTPYVRVDTRVTYFRKLAAKRELVSVIEPAEVPQIASGPLANVHMPDGYWWYITSGASDAVRYLCCTMRVAHYRPDDWFGAEADTNGGRAKKLQPVLFGVSTKQVSPTDPNALAKAETGAIGRALGVAGILVIGTGIATAEDMTELDAGPVQQGAALPAAEVEAVESEEQLNERCLGLQARLKEDYPDGWAKFAAWWQERRGREGWNTLNDAPIEVRRGVATRMEELLAEGATQDSSSPAEEVAEGGEG